MNRSHSGQKAPGQALRMVLTGCVLGCILHGCNAVGPQSIRGGGMAYNEAIAETNAQQMLMVPVHNRYEEANHMLAVASVTANVRVSSSTVLEAGFGNSDNYDGNLVPFRGGFVYEENPTISYTPVSGEAYLQQLIAPVPLIIFSQMSQILPEPGFIYDMVLASINDIHNPAFLFDDQQDDHRFDRLVHIMTSLTRQNRLHWVSDTSVEDSLVLLIRKPAGDATVIELLELLQLPTDKAGQDLIVIPVTLALDGITEDGIGMTTRSLWELLEILSAAVEVPAEDERSGVAVSFPRLGRAGRELKIGYSEERPENAYVAVEYRDGWFAIDDRDQATKRYFKYMGSFWAAAISQSLGSAAAAPVLTVPVSR